MSAKEALVEAVVLVAEKDAILPPMIGGVHEAFTLPKGDPAQTPDFLSPPKNASIYSKSNVLEQSIRQSPEIQASFWRRFQTFVNF